MKETKLAGEGDGETGFILATDTVNLAMIIST
jgi:hypothetical protein